MPRSIIFGSTIVLTCALALPVSAAAQAGPRPSTSGSSSSGSSGSTGSSGSSGEGSSGSSGGSESRVGPSGGSSSIDNPRSSGRTAPSGGGSRVSASSREGGRVAAAPGGFAQRGSGGVNEQDTSAITGLDLNSRLGTRTGRTGNGSGVAGVAGVRTFDLTPVSFPFYGPWGNYYPWLGSGLGYGYGYVYYDPWRYGATSWLWGRYGMWYDPWGYDPQGSYSYSSSGYSSSVRDVEPKRTGNIRLKANEKKAKVYIDGALVGVVDEFDGLSDHLELEGGPHQLELRAEGYEPYVGVLVVEAGKTLTERVSLKRVKK